MQENNWGGSPRSSDACQQAIVILRNGLQAFVKLTMIIRLQLVPISPTASPTQNDCADGTHHCDATNGFCLMAGHSSYTCGCNTNYVLLGDLRTCVFQSGVNRL